MRNLSFFFLILSLCFSCKTPSSTSNNSKAQAKSGDSTRYANVFKPWDGHWKGKFLVLNHPEGQREGKSMPRLTQREELMAMNLDTGLVINVEQRYNSTSPYYQTVAITDRYMENGKEKVVKSEGYNEVRGDSLICVVKKPSETVVHQGEDLGEGMIIWSRTLKDPLKAEYFYEVATDSAYTIVGWGYYGSDDLEKEPKTYFYGKYQKQAE